MTGTFLIWIYDVIPPFSLELNSFLMTIDIVDTRLLDLLLCSESRMRLTGIYDFPREFRRNRSDLSV
jgi:hypothetical protein